MRFQLVAFVVLVGLLDVISCDDKIDKLKIGIKKRVSRAPAGELYRNLVTKTLCNNFRSRAVSKRAAKEISCTSTTPELSWMEPSSIHRTARNH